MENQQTPEGIKKIIDLAIDAVTDKISVRDGRICYANFSGGSYEAENINQEDLVDKIAESILPIISHHQEANAKLVEALRDLINANPLHDGYHEIKLKAIQLLQTYKTK